MCDINERIPLRESSIKVDKNAIGSRGEAIATVRFTEGNLFRVYFLGEKAPTIDCLLELTDDKYPFFALLQVKTTSKILARANKLSISLSKDDLMKLQLMALPTYLVGVEEQTEVLYFAPIFYKHKMQYTSSIPTRYMLKAGEKDKNLQNLRKLKNEIIAYSIPTQKRKLTYKTKLKI